MRLLINHGANPYLKDRTERDALEIARHMKREETIQVLEEFYLKNKIE